MGTLKYLQLWEFDKWYTPKYYKNVGVFFFLLYVFFQVLWEPAGNIGETASALLGLFGLLLFGKGLRKSGALWLLLAAILVQILSWGLMYQFRPEWVPDNPQLDRLAKLFIFIAVAWWLGGSTRNTLIAWSLALIGFIAATFIHGEGIGNWVSGIVHGERVGFGIRNNQHASMLYGVCAIGLFAFAKRFIYRPELVGWRFAVWFFLFGLTLLALLIGQTRAVWIAVAVALLMMFCFWVSWKVIKGDRKSLLRSMLVGVLSAGVLLGSAGWFLGGTLMNRGVAEKSVISEVLQGDVANVPYSSIGIRIHSWVAASEWIAQRPLTGWGPWGRGLVIDHTSWLPAFVKSNFGHLHNFFIEIWVSYGVIGLALIASLAAWIAQATWRAWRGGVLPNDMALFSICFFVYWMMVNQLESYMSFWTGVYVFNLVVGGLITHYWRWLLQVKNKKTSEMLSGNVIKESTAL